MEKDFMDNVDKNFLSKKMEIAIFTGGGHVASYYKVANYYKGVLVESTNNYYKFRITEPVSEKLGKIKYIEKDLYVRKEFVIYVKEIVE